MKAALNFVRHTGGWRYAVEVALLAAAYFAAAKVALLYAIPPGYATPVWPSSGIALAALLLLGYRAWPGVWLGAALVNFTVNASMPLALLIASGNTLEALVGAALVRRQVGIPYQFERSAEVVRFVAATVLAGAVAASVAIVPLAVSHSLAGADLYSNWWTWWQGDVAGMILVTPLILSWCGRGAVAWTRRKILEASAFCLLLGLAAALIFGGNSAFFDFYPMKFSMVLFVIWAAYRFSQREVTTAVAVIAVIALWDSAGGLGASSPRLNETLLVLLAFNVTLAITGLVLCAVARERGAAMEELERARLQLEARVQERTAELERANEALATDIARRVQAEQQLRASEERFRQMVVNVVDYAILMLDPEGRVIGWNAGAERIMGYRIDEITGQHYSRFYHPEDTARGKPQRMLELAAAEGRHQDEARHIRKDGSMFWANVVITRMLDASGNLIGYSKVTRDLTERRHAEAELVRARAVAEQASAEKSLFLAKMSHEFRTPLNSLMILAQLLSENAQGNLTAKQVEYANTIFGAGTDLTVLVSDILQAARDEWGRPAAPLSLAPERVADLRDYCERTFRPVAASKRLAFSIEIGPAVPATFHTAAHRLRQVLNNLLANAFRFTSTGGVTLRVERVASGWSPGHAQLDAAPGVIAFSVTDTGVGFTSEFRDVMFQEFRREHHQPGSTGLGLAISRQLVERLGGEIAAAARPGHGSTFTVYLPLTEADASAETSGQAPLQRPERTTDSARDGGFAVGQAQQRRAERPN